MICGFEMSGWPGSGPASGWPAERRSPSCCAGSSRRAEAVDAPPSVKSGVVMPGRFGPSHWLQSSKVFLSSGFERSNSL